MTMSAIHQRLPDRQTSIHILGRDELHYPSIALISLIKASSRWWRSPVSANFKFIPREWSAQASVAETCGLGGGAKQEIVVSIAATASGRVTTTWKYSTGMRSA
jgi:hypothetical protein